ncbi:hypothetical protein [Nonomuraea sp. NPDC049684]|uniref:hypothetical protein n=1 Tax=unclassified Nonomuraea TaxID=2593643 RepID=UPI00378DA4B0
MKGSITGRVVLAALVFAAVTGGAAASYGESGPDDGGKAFTACVRAHGLPAAPQAPAAPAAPVLS